MWGSKGGWSLGSQGPLGVVTGFLGVKSGENRGWLTFVRRKKNVGQALSSLRFGKSGSYSTQGCHTQTTLKKNSQPSQSSDSPKAKKMTLNTRANSLSVTES